MLSSVHFLKWFRSFFILKYFINIQFSKLKFYFLLADDFNAIIFTLSNIFDLCQSLFIRYLNVYSSNSLQSSLIQIHFVSDLISPKIIKLYYNSFSNNILYGKHASFSIKSYDINNLVLSYCFMDFYNVFFFNVIQLADDNCEYRFLFFTKQNISYSSNFFCYWLNLFESDVAKVRAAAKDDGIVAEVNADNYILNNGSPFDKNNIMTLNRIAFIKSFFLFYILLI